MKITRLILFAWAASLGFLEPKALAIPGSGTNGTRINDWGYSGCNQSPGAAGAPASGASGAGGNQASCPTCQPDGGIPRWFVDEPNINLHVSDTPLEYTTSSGQKISFRLFYKQRYLVTPPDQCELCQEYSTNQGVNDVNAHSMGLTNASWNHNWMMDLQFWDTHWENDGTARGNPVYSDSYEVLVYNPNGAVDYYYSNLNSATYLGDPQRQNGLRPLSGLGYPTVSPFGPTADTNGIYWGDPAQDDDGVYTTNGFEIVYSDGSQDLFALAIYTLNGPDAYSPESEASGDTLAHAYLTQRIDPAGRVTRLGYESLYFTSVWDSGAFPIYTYRLKYLVDSDGRTNTFYYTNQYPLYAWELSAIQDPFGRSATFTENDFFGNGSLASITDAQSNTTTFGYTNYQATNYWLNSITTPFGTTSFAFDQEPGDPDIPFSFSQRAIYASEPDGAQQFFLFLHANSNGVPATLTAPSVTGQSKFDDGTNNTGSDSVYPLFYRNTFHWDRRQFAALSSNVVSDLESGVVTNAINDLTAADFMKARLSHWLLAADSGAYVTDDGVSMTEFLSLERDPSPDAAGLISGAWTWYNYANKPYSEQSGDAQINCIAQILPNGQVQYTRYNYNTGNAPKGGLVSDNEASVTLPNGTAGELTNWFSYAANNIDLASTSDSLGRYLHYGYNSLHEVIAVTNAGNQITTNGYSSLNHNLSSVYLPSGQSMFFTYYPSNNPATTTNALLKRIEVEPQGLFINFSNYTYNLPSVVYVTGTGIPDLWVTNFWDGLNHLTGTAFQDGTTTSNIFTILDLTAHQDRMTNWTYFAYDSLEHLTNITDANSGVTSLSWCGCGALTSITDALLTNTTYLNYDNQGRLTNKVFADGSSLTYQYDLNGRMTNVLDGSGRWTKLAYNNQGLATIVSNSYGPLTQITYDLVNRPISVTDANGITVTNGYDLINRLTNRVWTFDGIGEIFVYATNGLIAYTNRNGQPTHFLRDGAGRVAAVTNANSQVTQFSYDSANHLTTLRDGANHSTTWHYNQYGWLTNKIDATNVQDFLYTYNANGWLTNRWMPATGNTGYGYDPVGNLTSIVYSNVATTHGITFAYDADNRLVNMQDTIGTSTFGYTPTGQLASETNAFSTTSGVIRFGYTQEHRTSLSLSQPSGAAWTNLYAYDNAWRMTGLTAPSGSFGYGYAATASSLIHSLSLPNAAGIAYQYDSLARLTNTALANYWGQVLDGYGYAYDYLGQRKNITRNLGLTANNIIAGYDNIGQLTSWTAAETNGTTRFNEQLGYGYDNAGNLAQRTNNLLVQTFAVDTLNQLSTVSRTGTFTLTGATPAPVTNNVFVNGGAAQSYGDFTFARTNLALVNGNNNFTNLATNFYGAASTNILTANLPSPVSFTYDGNGNLTSDGTRTFYYDAENQLTNVFVASQWKTEFAYDGMRRRRIERDYAWQSGAWVRTNEVRLIYDGMLPIQERNSNNLVQVTYTRGLDLSLTLQGVGGIGGMLARTDTNSTVYYHADGNGNITALIDGNQNIVGRYEYDAFGRMLGMWGVMAPVNHIRYSSKYELARAEIYDFGYRWSLVNPPRFLNRDPIQEAGGLNLYRINFNSPLNAIDPYGLNWLILDGQAWGQLAHDVFYGPDYQNPTPAPDSQLALDANAGIGPTPLTDRQGNTMLPGDLVQDTVLDAAAQVAMLPIGGPEDEGAYAAAEQGLKKAAEDAAKAAEKCPAQIPKFPKLGYKGSKPYRDGLKTLQQGGPKVDLGFIPTQEQALSLLEDAGIDIDSPDFRIDLPHVAPNPHDYPHINYPTPSGGKGTIQIQ